MSLDDHTVRAGWWQRLRAAGIHLVLSGLVASLAALLVFVLWYPYPYREVSGGRELFFLVVSVDVVLGPLLTLAVFNTAKPRAALRRDLVVVALLQLAGLGYGLWTVNLARPVHLVFEIDRFRVIHRMDIPAEMEALAPAGIPVAPLTGPTPIALRDFKSPAQKMEYTLAALGGVHLGARSDLWQSYDAGRAQVVQAARPLADLKRRFPRDAAAIDAAVAASPVGDPARVRYLPLVARKAEAWTVLLDGVSGSIIGYLPIDSF